MKKILFTILLLVTSFTLAGCSEEKEKIYTVTEFAENNDLRKEWMAKCKENPGELRMTPNCTNAFAGQKKSDLDELRRKSEEARRQIEAEKNKSN